MAKKRTKSKKPNMLLPAVAVIILLAVASMYLSTTANPSENDGSPDSNAPAVDVTIQQIPQQERPIVGSFVAVRNGHFVLEIDGEIEVVPFSGDFPVAERFGPKLNIIALEDIPVGSEVTIIRYVDGDESLVSAVVVENN